MTPKIALIFGAGIILSLITISVAVFPVFNKTEEKLGNLILQKKPVISQSSDQTKTKQKSTTTDTPASNKNNDTAAIKDAAPKIKLTEKESKLMQILDNKAQLESQKQQLKTTTNTPASNKNNDTAAIKDAAPKIKLTEEDIRKQLNALWPPAISTSKTLLSSTEDNESTSATSTKIFNKFWPKSYIAHLKDVQQEMITEGFAATNSETVINPLNTNKKVFKFLDALVLFMVAKETITIYDASSLGVVLKSMEDTMNDPEFTFPEPSTPSTKYSDYKTNKETKSPDEETNNTNN